MRKLATAGAVLAIGTVVGLVATQSGANESFTLAMEDAARKDWEKKFNDTVGKPFSKIKVCTKDEKMSLRLGKGCVEAATTDICCDNWTIDVKCSDKNKWEQKGIEGSFCEQKKREDDK